MIQASTNSNQWYAADRLGGLRRFAAAITIFTILGHVWFGFEQSWAQPLVGLAAAYSTEFLLELVDAWVRRRPYRFAGGFKKMVDFFLPAQISGLACSMLLYANDRLWLIAFAASLAIASKTILRIRLNHQSRHFYNPSNFGITVTLLLFPWVGIAPPYHFTENLQSVGDWLVPMVIVCSGSFLNTRYTRRLPLITAWLSCFALQALIRHWTLGSSLPGALMPMSGVAFILYTFYMVTDPPTTPTSTRGQVAFGAAVAAAYGLLMVFHIVFGLFFALTIVSTVRGTYHWAREWMGVTVAAVEVRPAPAPATLIPEPAGVVQAAMVGRAE
ncbi:MAG: enediyne biosynthesis protein UnbU [Planctomycetia bacterium]|nr:enediyne biosynthesis protein UnbU [Planctomycetia bacterium]